MSSTPPFEHAASPEWPLRECPTPPRHMQVGMRQSQWTFAERSHLLVCQRCRRIQWQLLQETRPALRGLIADDSPEARRFIELALKKLNVELTSVEDGDAAVDRALQALADNQPFDFFLLDFKMPALDGCSAALALRAQGYGQPPVMILTEWTDNEELQTQCRKNEFALLAKNQMNRVRLASQVELALVGAPPQSSLAT